MDKLTFAEAFPVLFVGVEFAAPVRIDLLDSHVTVGRLGARFIEAGDAGFGTDGGLFDS